MSRSWPNAFGPNWRCSKRAEAIAQGLARKPIEQRNSGCRSGTDQDTQIGFSSAGQRVDRRHSSYRMMPRGCSGERGKAFGAAYFRCSSNLIGAMPHRGADICGKPRTRTSFLLALGAKTTTSSACAGFQHAPRDVRDAAATDPCRQNQLN